MSTNKADVEVYGLHSIVNPETVGVANSDSIELSFISGSQIERDDDKPEKSAQDILAENMDRIEKQLGSNIFEPDRNAEPSDDRFSGSEAKSAQRADDASSYDQVVPDDSASTGYTAGVSRQRANDYSASSQAPTNLSNVQPTDEWRRRDRILSTMNAHAIPTGSFLREETENDEKLCMIEEIQELIALFKEDGDDMSSFTIPTPNSSYDEINCTLKILRRHNDRKRFSTLADDLIMMLATGLAKLMDGKREFFGFKPNLTGWQNHVRTKLRRMRYETSHIASSIMNDFNIGPGARILIELLPNMVMYAHDHSATDANAGGADSSAIAPDVSQDTISNLRAK